MKLFSRLLLVCSPFLVGLLLTGCASAPVDPIFTSTPTQPSGLDAGTGSSDQVNFNPNGPGSTPTVDTNVARFRVGDTVVVQLSGIQDVVPPHEESIKEDGSITMPIIGRVQAAGISAGELQNNILKLYVPMYYKHLTVTVKPPQDRLYFVGGEVKMPNRYVYTSATTVTRAIQAAGDFTDFANKTKVLLIRANGERLKVNCEKAMSDPSQDPLVYPGDQIQVPRSYWGW